MNLNLTGKNAFVGGGSKGIGLASAVELALLGANVIIASRSEEDLKVAIKLLDIAKGQTHDYLVVDYSNLPKLKTKVEQLVLKKKGIQILVNNTGGPAGGPIKDATSS